MPWKLTDGTLNIFTPLIGTWVAQSDSPKGPVMCTRVFTKTLNGQFIEVRTDWKFPHNSYQELGLIGLDENRFITFWTFDSDGNRAAGRWIKLKQRHPHAFGFEIEMSHGFTRQIYCPHAKTGFEWTVEMHAGNDWQQLLKHHYKPFDL
ncbi:hypothetical protein [Marinicella sp. W31]|uniref:hypothetical protein n=1 Tax=Marinicella sp. W31 TaxID=3023713 RepID=UPI00375681DC